MNPITITGPGAYRTRNGRVIEIVAKHPRYSTLWVSDKWKEPITPGEYWWDTGVHPHNGDVDLVAHA